MTLDGRPVSIRPLGAVRDLLQGNELRLETCDGSPITMDDGRHDLIVGGGLQPDSIVLSTGDRPEPAGPPLPGITASEGSGGRLSIEVKNAQGPFFLVIGQNYDTKWKASIQGRDLGPPTVLDGYSAGWWIDRLGSYAVSVRYGQQRLYTMALALSVATLLIVIAVVIFGLMRRRPR
jgi:arabinofuranan 3-O-arabinosyltransferase